MVTFPRTDRRTHRGSLATRLTGSRPVLMYHGVGTVTEDPFSLFVSPARFGQQMWALRLLGLRAVSLGELGDALAVGEASGLVGLTFDDGYRDVVTWVPPILERHGFTATVFVVSGLLGGENVWDPPPRRPLVSEAEIRELSARGWEIGAHGVSHARSTDLDRDRLRAEIAGSRATLTAVTGTAPRCFCYPYGSVDADAVTATQEAGYTYACAVERAADLPDLLSMPRVGVNQRDHVARFAAKLFLRGR